MELAETAERARGASCPRFAAQTPRFLRELLAFPYVDGFAFVARERATASWAAIDAIWARPPESTTQILHPEKYDRRQSPIEIELPPLPLMGDGLRLARADTLGELVLRIWLAAPGPGLAADPLLTPRPQSARPPAGAAIASRSTCRPPPMRPRRRPADAGAPAPARSAAALAWLTTWESDADADDFLQSVAPRLAALAAGGEREIALPIDTDRPSRGLARARRRYGVRGAAARDSRRVAPWCPRGGASFARDDAGCAVTAARRSHAPREAGEALTTKR